MVKSAKTVFGLVIFSTAAVVAVKTATVYEMPKSQTIIISVIGTENRAVDARIVTDGIERKHHGMIPVEFTVEAHRLSWEVKRLDGPENETFKVTVHTPSQENWGGSAESYQVLCGGSVGASGLRRKRAWLGRFHE